MSGCSYLCNADKWPLVTGAKVNVWHMVVAARSINEITLLYPLRYSIRPAPLVF